MDITMLYYDKENPLQLQRMYLDIDENQHGGRMVIDPLDKQGKIILAILEGDVLLLNALGERALP